MCVTSPTDIKAILDGLLSRLRDTIGAKLVGVYLYGSLVMGDFDHESSDIDLLVVMSSEIDGDFGALQRMHRDFTDQHPSWEDRLDIAYLSADALRTFGTHASMIAVISPGEPFHRKSGSRDWLMNWYLVREHGRTLAGPPAATLIRPISKDEFVEIVREHAQHWSAWIYQARTRKAQAYAILTMCRALYAHRHGEQASKIQAARWALQEVPRWSSLIQNALAWRRAWRDDDVDHGATFPQTLRFVQYIIRRIAAD